MIVQAVTCPVFVGRVDELEALAEARRALSRSRGSVVLVSGDAGIGKSRLLAQFLGSVARDTRPRYLASTECSDLTEAPFAPFRQLIASLRDAVPAEEIPDFVRATIDVFAPRGGRAALATAQRPLERNELFEGITAFLLALAERRATILTIEDIHWADRSTLELLGYLAPRIAKTRLMIVATYRSHEVTAREPLLAALSRIARENNVVHVGLEPFEAAGMRELLGFAIGRRPGLAPHVMETLVRRSEGNPFFGEELLKDALESGGGIAPLPLSIRASIGERLAQFSPAERRVIEHAAVLGVPFEPELLATTLGADVDDVLPALRLARNLNLLVEEERGTVRFRFRHALTRQAVYDGLLIFDVRRTHARLLAALEALPEPDRHIDALAHHAWQARDTAKTLAYGERAGEAALALRALPEARACFERALEAASAADAATRARLQARVASVAEMQGDLADAIAGYEAALALELARGDFDRAADLVRAIATDRSNLADRGAVAYGIAFLDDYGDRVSQPHRDTLLALLARLAAIISDHRVAAELASRIADPNALPPRAKQNYFTVQMEAAFAAGDRSAFARLVPPLWAILDELDPFNVLVVCYNLAPMAQWFGDAALSERTLARAAEIQQRWSFEAVRIYGLAVKAQHAYIRGELAEAREFVLTAQRGSEAKVGAHLLAIYAPLIAAALGDGALVRQAEDEIFERSVKDGSVVDDAMIVTAGAVWRIATGRAAEGRRALRRALAWIPRPEPWLASVFVFAACHLDEGDLGALRELATLPVREDDSGTRAYVAFSLAVIDKRTGKEAEGAAAARRAAREFRSLGWPLFEALAHEAAGDSSAAIEIYERCGAAADVGRLRPRLPAAAHSPLGASLSKRELAVARALATGATNAAIGETLGVSVKTVEKYVSSIFVKLGVSKRAQVAALFAREDRTPIAGG